MTLTFALTFVLTFTFCTCVTQAYLYAEPDDRQTLIQDGTVYRFRRSFELSDADISSPDIDLSDALDVRHPENKISQMAEEKSDFVANDTHKYYQPNNASFESIWVDLDLLNQTNQGMVKEHPMLSKSYRRAATIGLKFSFPFYGHDVSNLTIATGGFIYTGQYVHSWLAATQYIAPLMANFDTSQDDRAKIRYADNGTALIVEWENVYLKKTAHGENGTSITNGPFTFQAILHQTGDIFFAYKMVPVEIGDIWDKEHPVKVGLSDAYIIDRTIFFVRRKTIYEYHRLSLDHLNVTNHTAIKFSARPTCNRMKNCTSCLQGEAYMEEGLKCKWCPNAKLCSDGTDRNRQTWIKHRCTRDQQSIDQPQQCKNEMAYINVTPDPPGGDLRDVDDYNYDESIEDSHMEKKKLGQGEHKEATNTNKSVHIGLVTLTIVCVVFGSLLAWLCYAYFFPHSWSGQVLIKYRPTRWQWLRSEPRYTAASIHM